MRLLRTDGGASQSVRPVSAAPMRLLWISEILQRMWIIVCIIIMIIADDNADCFIFTRPPTRQGKSPSPISNLNQGKELEKQQKSRSNKPEYFPELLFTQALLQTSRIETHNTQSLNRYSSKHNNFPAVIYDWGSKSHHQNYRISSKSDLPYQPFSSEHKGSFIPLKDMTDLWQKFKRPFANLAHTSWNQDGWSSAIDEGKKKNALVEAEKRKMEPWQRMAPQSSHDFNQVRKKREFEEMNSQLACPYNFSWIPLNESHDMKGEKVKIEQPPAGADQRRAQYFYVVTCNTSQSYRPDDCPMCCIGIDRTRYESRCQEKAIYVRAHVRTKNSSTETGWSNEVVINKIRVMGSCLCQISPK